MIEIFPTYYKIYDYDIGDSKGLEFNLNVWDPAIFDVTFSAYHYDEDNKILYVPRGYDQYSIINALKGKKVIDRENEHYLPKHCIFDMKYDLRDDKQNEAFNFLLGNNNEYHYTQKLLSLETGAGKTFVTIYYISKNRLRPMIILPNIQMVKQWKEEFLNLTNLKEDDIGIISGSDTIDEIVKTPNKYKVYLASHRTLDSYSKDNPREILDALFSILGIGIKIYDEAHTEWKNIINIDLSTTVKETIYLTATPNRSNPHEDKVYQAIFDDIPIHGLEYKYKNPDKNYHKVILTEFNSKPDIDTRANVMTHYGFNVNNWASHIVNNSFDSYYSHITKILDLSIENGITKFAIVASTLAQTKAIQEALISDYGDKFTVGNYSGVVPNKDERKLELKKDIIVTTDRSFDMGINVMDLEVLINTSPLSSKVKVEQLLGRLRYVENKPTIFFDVTDKGFKSCRNQLRERKKVYDFKAEDVFELKF